MLMIELIYKTKVTFAILTIKKAFCWMIEQFAKQQNTQTYDMVQKLIYTTKLDEVQLWLHKNLHFDFYDITKDSILLLLPKSNTLCAVTEVTQFPLGLLCSELLLKRTHALLPK